MSHLDKNVKVFYVTLGTELNMISCASRKAQFCTAAQDAPAQLSIALDPPSPTRGVRIPDKLF
jgi:hypothetical protein